MIEKVEEKIEAKNKAAKLKPKPKMHLRRHPRILAPKTLLHRLHNINNNNHNMRNIHKQKQNKNHIQAIHQEKQLMTLKEVILHRGYLYFVSQ